MKIFLKKYNKFKNITYIKDAILWGSDILKKHNIENYKKESQLLLAHAINSTYLNVITEKQNKIKIKKINLFINLIFRRINNEPFAYIVGNKEFMGFIFFVNKNVLIPRPDTEVIVEKALSVITNNKKYKCLDICAGTGCIGISLALIRKNLFVDFIDICQKAINVLKKNVSKFNLHRRIRIIKSNLLNSYDIKKKLDLIIANPPYISNKDYLKLSKDIRYHEPKKALVADSKNPLILHEIIIKNTYKYLKNHGVLILEFGINQEKEIEKINNGLFQELTFFKDYSNIIRGCILKKII